MFNTSCQASAPNSFCFTKILPIIGVSLIASAASVEARPIVIINQPPLPTTQIIGSPIPSPVPLVPGTTMPYSLSPYNNSYRDYNTVIVPGSNIINNSPYNNYRDYNTVIVPGRSIINNSMLNPRIINPRISDSVLINPVIINSPRYPVVPYRDSRFIYSSPYNSGFIYTSPGIQIRLGQ
ncbi:MAG: hypothetical protein WA828_09350 [Coleofasciculaceae cyanobacterium]